jgi:hypothetical protein
MDRSEALQIVIDAVGDAVDPKVLEALEVCRELQLELSDEDEDENEEAEAD